MTKTNEERLSTLEESNDFLKEGMREMKEGIREVKETLAMIVEKLDGRYVSKESFDLRVQTLCDALKEVEKRQDATDAKINKLQKWQYTVTGGGVLLGFVIGIASHVIKIG